MAGEVGAVQPQGVAVEPAPFKCSIDVWQEPICPSPQKVPGSPLPSSLLVVVRPQRGGPWVAGPAVAIVTTVIALGAHLTVPGWDHRFAPLLIGAAAGILAGVGVTLVSRSADRACDTYPNQVKEIIQRVRETLTTIDSSPLSAPGDRETARYVCSLLNAVATHLPQPGPEWLDGSGFLDCWKALHEAEETVLLIAPESDVTSAALYDLLRLNGSKIPAKDALVNELRDALPLLSAAAAAQVRGPSTCVRTPDIARRRIRRVRDAINEDRESQWQQIVGSRNGLITAGAVALGVAYVLIVLAVGFSAAPAALGSALVYALIGAIVSGAYQLQFRSNAPNDVEDFGFATVKLVVVPILAGMTALLAILFLTQFQLIISGQTLGASFKSWQSIFDWRHNPTAVATAILFGFAPSLFFSLLQSKVNDAMTSIKASQPSGGPGH